MQREYEVIYQEIEDGWIIAIVPDLPDAVTQEQDMDQARANSTRRTPACGRTFCSRRCTPTIPVRGEPNRPRFRNKRLRARWIMAQFPWRTASRLTQLRPIRRSTYRHGLSRRLQA